MDGYSEIGAIYYSIGNKTSFAKIDTTTDTNKDQWQKHIECGTYTGCPPYRPIKSPLNKLAKQYHCAEHLVYNSFMQKIKKLPANAKLEEFQKYIPSFEEIKKTSAHSFFCGTSFLLSSSILLLLSCIPNLMHWTSSKPIFSMLIFAFSILMTLMTSQTIQHKLFLSEPEEHQIFLARLALKEVLKNESSCKSNDRHID